MASRAVDDASTSSREAEVDNSQKDIWEWWNEENTNPEGCLWHYLEHKGPVFAPAYEPLPDEVKFYYEGKAIKLTPEAEEVAVFYRRRLDHKCTTKAVFNNNFFEDWRKTMSSKEKEDIRDLKKCNFNEINEYFKMEAEKRKQKQKSEIEIQKEKIEEEFGFCVMDGHRQKIGNFRIEHDGLFKGRGKHPQIGMLKKRIVPEDVTINCSENAPIPKAPPGHKWKEVRHDNKVAWLCSWKPSIPHPRPVRYITLNAASKIKGEKDLKKYETARELHQHVEKIRAKYREDWNNEDPFIRQRAVAMYFLDKLALRAGNEKDEDTADTVGCCSIRVEHITLHEKLDDKKYVVEFDFPGKSSIRYWKEVSMEKQVFENLESFKENKNTGDDLFHLLKPSALNKYLQSFMDGLTAKVFRTYNACCTFQEQLKLLTKEDDTIADKKIAYSRANEAAAELCNHRRTVKRYTSILDNNVDERDKALQNVKKAKFNHKASKAAYKEEKSVTNKKAFKKNAEAKKMAKKCFSKHRGQPITNDETKVSLGTSKLSYLDPRITVAWCKKFGVPIEEIFSKAQREKFAWAIATAKEEFEF